MIPLLAACSLNLGICLFGLVLLIVILGFISAQTTDAKPDAVTFENAKEALGRMTDWAKWLVTLQGGAMAAVGFLNRDPAGSEWQYGSALLCLIFLALSDFGFAWLLAGMPSIQQRIAGGSQPHRPDRYNDIYHKRLFHTIPWLQWLTVERTAAFSHYTGILGLLFFAGYFFAGMSAPQKASPTDKIVDAIHELSAEVRGTHARPRGR